MNITRPLIPALTFAFAMALPGTSLAAGGTTAQQVTVTNTAAQPVPVSGTVAVSNGAANPLMANVKQRERFQATINADHTSDQSDFYANASVTFTIPAGKKLIVEHVSTFVVSNAGYQTIQVLPDIQANSGFLHFFPTAKQGLYTGTYYAFLGSDSTPMTATSTLTVRTSGSYGLGLYTSVYASVSGYLVPVNE